jgi:hypothetical protein
MSRARYAAAIAALLAGGLLLTGAVALWVHTVLPFTGWGLARSACIALLVAAMLIIRQQNILLTGTACGLMLAGGGFVAGAGLYEDQADKSLSTGWLLTALFLAAAISIGFVLGPERQQSTDAWAQYRIMALEFAGAVGIGFATIQLLGLHLGVNLGWGASYFMASYAVGIGGRIYGTTAFTLKDAIVTGGVLLMVAEMGTAIVAIAYR